MYSLALQDLMFVYISASVVSQRENKMRIWIKSSCVKWFFFFFNVYIKTSQCILWYLNVWNTPWNYNIVWQFNSGSRISWTCESNSTVDVVFIPRCAEAVDTCSWWLSMFLVHRFSSFLPSLCILKDFPDAGNRSRIYILLTRETQYSCALWDWELTLIVWTVLHLYKLRRRLGNMWMVKQCKDAGRCSHLSFLVRLRCVMASNSGQ